MLSTCSKGPWNPIVPYRSRISPLWLPLAKGTPLQTNHYHELIMYTSNEGDVSPNTMGAKCPDGTPCADDSTCGGKNEHCIAAGPGVDMFDSTRIIGIKWLMKTNNNSNPCCKVDTSSTKRLSFSNPLPSSWPALSPIVTCGSTWPTSPCKEHTLTTDNPTIRVGLQWVTALLLVCTAIVILVLANAHPPLGTTDGPGAFDFTQGDNNTNGNAFWNWLSDFIAKPTPDQIECQAPKPILLDVGQTKPIPWAPDVVAVQVTINWKVTSVKYFNGHALDCYDWPISYFGCSWRVYHYVWKETPQYYTRGM